MDVRRVRRVVLDVDVYMLIQWVSLSFELETKRADADITGLVLKGWNNVSKFRGDFRIR
jgi:hypothetical protein